MLFLCYGLPGQGTSGQRCSSGLCFQYRKPLRLVVDGVDLGEDGLVLSDSLGALHLRVELDGEGGRKDQSGSEEFHCVWLVYLLLISWRRSFI